MTTLSDPPKESFQLSMLLNDTRYRSLTFQAIALFVLIASFAYLGSNLMRNLEAAGLNISYDFLGAPAGYDVGQQLIEYDSQDSNGRAALVGILNTLLVAALACVTATVFGVIAGVLRLSNNWLVSKLMSFYVEIFRNIPVLIWIIIIFTIMIAVMPGPREFRGDDPSASMIFDAIAFTNRGVYIPGPVWGPGSMVVVATFILSVIGIFAYRKYATNLLYATGKMLPMLWPCLAIFFVPSLLMFFIMGMPIGLDIPALKGFNFQGGIKVGGPLIALWFALSIY